jgi:Bifunctional DNA primase/polymerase, N-terminal
MIQLLTSDERGLFIDYAKAGRSLVPIAEDKAACVKWAPLQYKALPWYMLGDWFDGPRAVNRFGCIGGQMDDAPDSGWLVCLDFDAKLPGGGSLYDEYYACMEAQNPGVLPSLVLEKSPSGGMHAWFRSPHPVGSVKLALSTPHEVEDGKGGIVTTRDSLIETKGVGGYALCYPSLGYTKVSGSLVDVPLLTELEVEELLTTASSLTAYRQPANGQSGSLGAGDGKPGSGYNRRVKLEEVQALLESKGWTVIGEGARGGIDMTRPAHPKPGSLSANLMVMDGGDCPFVSFLSFDGRYCTVE